MVNRNAMKLMTAVLLTAMLLLSLSLIGVNKAYACSCVMPGTYAEEMEKSSHVLDATVVQKTTLKQGTTDVELSVTAVWKGEAERETHVITSDNSAACGYEFNIGTRYAVFANETDGVLHVSLCSATTPIIDESSIFDELGQPEKLADEEAVDPPSKGQGDKAQAGATDASARPTFTATELTDALSPDRIQKTVSEAELVNKIDTQHTRLVIIFVVIGVLPIIAAAYLFLSRRKR